MVDKKGKADMEKDHYCKIIRTGNQKLFFNVTKVTKLQNVEVQIKVLFVLRYHFSRGSSLIKH